MRRLSGQAAKHLAITLHRLARLAMVAAVLVAVGVGWLGWRLSQGPLDMPWLTRYALHAIRADAGDLRISIGGMALAWEGFRLGADRPLDIRLSDVTIGDRANPRELQVPRARMSLSIAELLLGHFRPRAVVLDGPALSLVRRPDGSIRLGAAMAAARAILPPAGAAAPASASVPASPAAPAPALTTILAGLARPPVGDRAGISSVLLSQMRRISITDASLTLVDQRLGAVWIAPQATLDLIRPPRGGLDGTAHLRLALGGPASGGPGTTLDLTAHMAPLGGPQAGMIAMTARLGAVSPARLAAGVARLSTLAALDALVTSTAQLTLTPALALSHFTLNGHLGAGALHIAGGVVGLAGGGLAATGTADTITLDDLHLALAGDTAAPGAVLRLNGTLDRTAAAEPGWRAALHLGIDRVDFAALPALWPPQVAADARAWITENITQGIASDGQANLTFATGPDFTDPVLTGAEGTVSAHDLTVHWLRPVPPLMNGTATLHWRNADQLSIDVTSAAQQGADGKPSDLVISQGNVRITGLTVHDQVATIGGQIAGPVAQALGLLAHPRLHLLSDHPFPLHDPAGDFTGTLKVTVPLEREVRMEDIGIAAHVELHHLHLGGIAAGRDLDQGEATLQADADGLHVAGTARVADLPARLSLAMDFRAGLPDQVVERVTLATRATPAALAHAGIDTGGLLTGGTADLDADLAERRNGTATLDVRAGLSDAALRIAPLGWEKPAGAAANGTAQLTLLHDRITALSAFDLTGDGIAVTAHAGFANGQLARLDLTQLRLGQTEATGSVDFPTGPGAPIAVRLSGPMVDLSARLGHHSAAPKPQKKPASSGPALSVVAHFTRARMAHDVVVRDLAIDLQDDGHLTQALTLGGVLPAIGQDAAAPFKLSIAKDRGGRQLSAETRNAGALLRALDITTSMQGGQLSLSGQYDDAAPDHPLNGTATIESFRVQGAPALGRVLQAMTLYGLVDVVAGPGLAFNKLVAPFSLTDEALELHDARAFSASLGLTAKGRIDLTNRQAALQGTIVPAYFFNTLLGHIPLIGRLFSPEQGGGVFAASYSVTGDLDDPHVSVNPLAALTPGVLRGLFGLF